MLRSSVLLALICITLLPACNSKAGEREDAIREWINSSIDDASSYEPVEFSEAEPIMGITQQASAKYLADSIIAAENQSSTIKPPPYEVLGMKVHHKFRAKNKMGALEMNSLYFYFDNSGAIYKVNDENAENIELAAEMLKKALR